MCWLNEQQQEVVYNLKSVNEAIDIIIEEYSLWL